MRTKHADRRGLVLALAGAAALFLVALPALAAELTVASYVELTIDRLELAHTTWSSEGRSPAETEEAALCQQYDTTVASYYTFAGDHAKEIAGYFEEHPEKLARVETLAAAIAAIIEREEVQ